MLIKRWSISPEKSERGLTTSKWTIQQGLNKFFQITLDLVHSKLLLTNKSNQFPKSFLLIGLGVARDMCVANTPLFQLFVCTFFFFQSHNLFTISPRHPSYIAAPPLLSGETILRKWLALSDYLDSHHRAPLRFSHTLQPTLCVPHGRDCWGPVGEWKVSTAEQRHVWHLASIPSPPRSYYCMKVPPTASAWRRAFSNSWEAASPFCAWEWRRRNKRSTWAKIRYEPCACYPRRFWPHV